EVKRIALAHVATIEEKVKALEAIRESLRHLAKACSGDRRPDCPILDGIFQRQVLAAPVAGRRVRSVEGLRHTGISGTLRE
ncbi:MAG: Cu(I)-responsive transcriptional regulator, partial [Planctomycetota bacterium]|nr:Cu(I)-responsive transcriptional regulator [Planctomycetota bacterium]